MLRIAVSNRGGLACSCAESRLYSSSLRGRDIWRSVHAAIRDLFDYLSGFGVFEFFGLCTDLQCTLKPMFMRMTR
jgi:hypothetical protein